MPDTGLGRWLRPGWLRKLARRRGSVVDTVRQPWLTDYLLGAFSPTFTPSPLVGVVAWNASTVFNAVLSNNNLTVGPPVTNVWARANSTYGRAPGSSSKYWGEFRVDSLAAAVADTSVAVVTLATWPPSTDNTGTVWLGQRSDQVALAGDGNIYQGNAQVGTVGRALVVGDYVGLGIESGNVQVRLNGGTPVSVSLPTDVVVVWSTETSGTSGGFTANFGILPWQYAPPTGFVGPNEPINHYIWSTTDRNSAIVSDPSGFVARKVALDAQLTGICTIPASGTQKLYFEVKVNVLQTAGDFGIGFLANGETRDTWAGNGGQAAIKANGDVVIDFGGSGGNLGALSANDIIQLGVDPVAKTVRWARNGGTPTADYSFTSWGSGGKTSVRVYTTFDELGGAVTLNSGASALAYTPWTGYVAPDAPTGGGYTLTADPGSFVLNGQAAGLLFGHVLVANQGSFSLNGQDVTLTKGVTLTADPGAFTLTGQDAAITRGLNLLADQGVYTLSGQQAGLLTARILTADAAFFTLSGQAAGFMLGKVMTVDVGTFTLTGQDAGLLWARLLTSDQGAFALNGQAALLSRALVLTADSGAFAITGQDAFFARGLLFVANFGTYLLSGQDANMLVTRMLTATKGTFTFTGQDAALNVGGMSLLADYGAFAVAGQAAGLLVGRVLTADPGAYTVAGQAAAFLVGKTLTADFGAYSLAGQDAALLRSRLLTSDQGSFAFAGQDATLSVSGRNLVADTGYFVLDGQPVAFVVAGQGQFTVSGPYVTQEFMTLSLSTPYDVRQRTA